MTTATLETMLVLPAPLVAACGDSLLWASSFCAPALKARPYGPLLAHQWDPCPSCDGPAGERWRPDGDSGACQHPSHTEAAR